MITRSVIESDCPVIDSWLRIRGAATPPREWYSDQGYIVDGIACAFLYTTNSGRASIEELTTNPIASSKDRFQAIQEITRSIIHAAKSLGFKFLIGYSVEPSVYERADELGFQVSAQNFRAIVKPLSVEG
jgi:hypothetical protein